MIKNYVYCLLSGARYGPVKKTHVGASYTFVGTCKVSGVRACTSHISELDSGVVKLMGSNAGLKA